MRRKAMDGEASGQGAAFVPVHLDDGFPQNAPIFKVRSDAQPADEQVDAGAQGPYRGIVEVVPMVVRDDEVVHVGNVVRGKGVRSFEGAEQEGGGGA